MPQRNTGAKPRRGTALSAPTTGTNPGGTARRGPSPGPAAPRLRGTASPSPEPVAAAPTGPEPGGTTSPRGPGTASTVSRPAAVSSHRGATASGGGNIRRPRQSVPDAA